MSSDKKGRSERKQVFWGRKYIQRYDEDGNEIGWSEEKESFFTGRKYTQHYDADGNEIGQSEKEEDSEGRKYTQHYDDEGHESGRSEEKQDFWGREYTQHTDDEGRESGWSEREKDFWGNEYTQHYGNEEVIDVDDEIDDASDDEDWDDEEEYGEDDDQDATEDLDEDAWNNEESGRETTLDGESASEEEWEDEEVFDDEDDWDEEESDDEEEITDSDEWEDERARSRSTSQTFPHKEIQASITPPNYAKALPHEGLTGTREKFEEYTRQRKEETNKLDRNREFIHGLQIFSTMPFAILGIVSVPLSMPDSHGQFISKNSLLFALIFFGPGILAAIFRAKIKILFLYLVVAGLGCAFTVNIVEFFFGVSIGLISCFVFTPIIGSLLIGLKEIDM